MKKTTAVLLVAVLAIVLGSTGLATMDMQKDLNAKYPTAKAKCISCHVKAMAKKGDAEVNAFGKDMMAKAIVDAKAEKKTFERSRPSTATATARATSTSSRPARTPAPSKAALPRTARTRAGLLRETRPFLLARFSARGETLELPVVEAREERLGEEGSAEGEEHVPLRVPDVALRPQERRGRLGGEERRRSAAAHSISS